MKPSLRMTMPVFKGKVKWKDTEKVAGDFLIHHHHCHSVRRGESSRGFFALVSIVQSRCQFSWLWGWAFFKTWPLVNLRNRLTKGKRAWDISHQSINGIQ